jgi:AcrR family transcriptional regulator
VKSNIVQKTKEKYLEYEERHTKIINGALRIFNQQGYKRTTTAAIAKEVGISEYTIYEHFENKKSLFLACFQSVVNDLMTLYRKVYKENIDNELGYIKGTQKAFLDFMEHNPDKSMIFYHMYGDKDDPEIGFAINDYLDRSIEVIKRALSNARKKGHIKSKIDDHSLAVLFLGMYFSLPYLKDHLNLAPKEFANLTVSMTDSLFGLG